MRTFLLITIVLLSRFCAAKENRKCGLPENYSKLPDFAQEELRAVWNKYVPGNKCDHELLITDDIMAVLEMFENEDNNRSSGSTASSKNPSTSPEPVDELDPTAGGPNHSEDLEPSEVLAPDSIPKTLVFPTLSPASSRRTTTRNRASKEKTRQVSTSYEDDEEGEDDEELTTYSPPPRRTTTSVRTTLAEEDYSVERTTPAHTRSRFRKTKGKKSRTRVPVQETTPDYDFQENLKDIKGPQTTPDVEKLPFLRSAPQEVVTQFQRVLNDNDIPSEERRQAELHLLAVSLLTSKQLQAYNSWSTSQRKRLRDQENDYRVSQDAQDALKTLSAMDSSKQRDFVKTLPRAVRRELREYSTRAMKQLNNRED
uniref:DUF148 domain-containing protein n=1 Tax=Steinernema glaseri TaxID=37863 RepID=A0A1I8ATT4_9BILA